ncbi:D-site 20S pre-rRNA nuclease [Cordyceps fumosorosea ARSEF 2679]|uniref:20S-pre-rRNA D-site endonuclease NOB1 n=1 Tax=Cordyceps fumosorosea (strain ARSEF 2679) TaxID=1081104 RepID=A0A167IM65_CORFA|nr:D-site 20S pre-rRNA nuclease [Cordyceps fumosorosea ARSEF 2679]OAA49219.1 D-site 20S pre-rRNA nuclease [Cordyceps fumosorosea ARSEF 2679]
MATPPPAPPSEAPAPTTITTKPIHSLVLDTGPLIKNDPTVSALLAQAEQLYILPSVVSEIRDAATRSRVETQLLPFVTVRSPNPKSVGVIREFARKTGDLGSLSKPDVEVLALAYELECERNGGDWRLRSSPDQKRVNGKPPQREEAATQEAEREQTVEGAAAVPGAEVPVEEMAKLDVADSAQPEDAPEAVDAKPEDASEAVGATQTENNTKSEPSAETEPATETADATHTQGSENADDGLVIDEIVEEGDDDEEDGEASDDDGGWITPSNIKKHKAQAAGSTPSQAPQRTLQAAVLTSDFAMQNVALRMNLNLVTPSFARITQLKTWVLRCHGCFAVTRQTERQFCPRCGQPTLLRTSCSTDAQGVARLHLKRGFQFNNRGNVYSVPKPVHGTPHGRLAKHAGGKNNWGAGLVLAEDQKEYVRAAEAQRRQKKRDLMDEEFLPGILTGDRSGGGKIKVGAGRSVNGRRRR